MKQNRSIYEETKEKLNKYKLDINVDEIPQQNIKDCIRFIDFEIKLIEEHESHLAGKKLAYNAVKDVLLRKDIGE